MAAKEKSTEGYVKTSNLYLCILVALSVGFLGGVLFSVYKFNRGAGVPRQAGGMSSPAPAMTQDQSQQLAALIQATKATPDNVGAWTQLGHLYFDMGKHSKAIEAYEKSLELDAKRPDVWTDLGVMYRRIDQPREALRSFDRALSIKNDHEIAMFNKGVVYMHDLDDLESALGAWEELLNVNPLAQAPSGQTVQSIVDQLKKGK